ncbi:hypothetical protein BB561_001725 [Smittium simulii]|uniref:Uncharacterized protein n=1 Tax=Smittium simulii TaxID=133385 RepID=A0A2T9YTB2_9FUNG|nr:hypothetical protein BB561_001725 [Smittium simulii]
MVLNEAIREKLVSKEEKVSVREQIADNYISLEERIIVIREMATLVMLGSIEKYKAVAKYGILGIGNNNNSTSANSSGTGQGNVECSLDPNKVYMKAVSAGRDPYTESILDVRKLKLGLYEDEISGLYELWEQTVLEDTGLNSGIYGSSSSSSQEIQKINSKSIGMGSMAHSEKSMMHSKSIVTLPILLHLLVYTEEERLQQVLISDYSESISERIQTLEDSALEVVVSLGLTWELSDEPIEDYRLLCVLMLVELGALLSKLVIRYKPRLPKNNSYDEQESSYFETQIFKDWFEVVLNLIKYESQTKSKVTSILLLYLMISSEKMLLHRQDFDPELFLAIVLELLTEYRKRRPSYTFTIVYPLYTKNNISSYLLDPAQNTNAKLINVSENRKQVQRPLGANNALEYRRKDNNQHNLPKPYETSSSSGMPISAQSTNRIKWWNHSIVGKDKSNEIIASKSSGMRTNVPRRGERVDKEKSEMLGFEFDRLYSWIDKLFDSTNATRAMITVPTRSGFTANKISLEVQQNDSAVANSEYFGLGIESSSAAPSNQKNLQDKQCSKSATVKSDSKPGQQSSQAAEYLNFGASSGYSGSIDLVGYPMPARNYQNSELPSTRQISYASAASSSPSSSNSNASTTLEEAAIAATTFLASTNDQHNFL